MRKWKQIKLTHIENYFNAVIKTTWIPKLASVELNIDRNRICPSLKQVIQISTSKGTKTSCLAASVTVFSSASVCQSVMNMMHVISIPYALMKVNPLSWIQKACQYKGNKINPNWEMSLSLFFCRFVFYVGFMSSRSDFEQIWFDCGLYFI